MHFDTVAGKAKRLVTQDLVTSQSFHAFSPPSPLYPYLTAGLKPTTPAARESASPQSQQSIVTLAPRASRLVPFLRAAALVVEACAWQGGQESRRSAAL